MKILVWNIKFFTKSRIVGQTSADNKLTLEQNTRRTKNDSKRAVQSLLYIVSTVWRTDPDVFVVVEPKASAGDPGTLADSDSGGPAGLIQLLAKLRIDSDQWCLVPPQRINSTRQDPIDPGSQYTECIGVFWRADRLTFTGPWVNTAEGARPTSFTGVVYDEPWKSTVPANTTAAGRCQYFVTNDSQQTVPLGFPDATSRRPFLTTFTEIGGTQRLLELYSVHCDTKEGAFAADSLAKLPFSNQANKATVIAGDFNINLSYPVGLGGTSIDTLAQNFGKLFPGPTVPILGTFDQYPPTMVRPGNKASPGDYYARDSKDTTGGTKAPETLDFAFLHYSAGAETLVPSCVVVNRVAGTPITTAMKYPLTDFTRFVTPLPLETFRDRYNYAKIGTPAKIPSSPAVLADGTSDHLPILLTV